MHRTCDLLALSGWPSGGCQLRLASYNTDISTSPHFHLFYRDGRDALLELVSLHLPKTRSSRRLSASNPPGCPSEMAAITFLPPSDATTMQLCSTKWRTSEADWESHRARIRQLYLEEDRPLNEVMAIMQRDHRFKATSDSSFHPA
jgi:hypothetical protein